MRDCGGRDGSTLLNSPLGLFSISKGMTAAGGLTKQISRVFSIHNALYFDVLMGDTIYFSPGGPMIQQPVCTLWST